MGKDIYADYRKAAAAANASGVVRVGLARNCAFDTGVADLNHYDGIVDGKLDLWAWAKTKALPKRWASPSRRPTPCNRSFTNNSRNRNRRAIFPPIRGRGACGHFF
jgi:hypothetical protein